MPGEARYCDGQEKQPLALSHQPLAHGSSTMPVNFDVSFGMNAEVLSPKYLNIVIHPVGTARPWAHSVDFAIQQAFPHPYLKSTAQNKRL
jgi:hypothetical protein